MTRIKPTHQTDIDLDRIGSYTTIVVDADRPQLVISVCEVDDECARVQEHRIPLAALGAIEAFIDANPNIMED